MPLRPRASVQARASGWWLPRAAVGCSFRESDVLRPRFETVLQRCIDAGLVGGEGLAVAASLIQADASDRNRVRGHRGSAADHSGRAVEEHLATLDDAAFGAPSEAN